MSASHPKATESLRSSEMTLSADIVAKVESCRAQNSWRKHYAASDRWFVWPQSRYRGRLWILRDAVRSPSSCTRKSRLRPAEFWSSAKIDFCNNICQEATYAVQQIGAYLIALVEGPAVGAI